MSFSFLFASTKESRPNSRKRLLGYVALIPMTTALIYTYILMPSQDNGSSEFLFIYGFQFKTKTRH